LGAPGGGPIHRVHVKLPSGIGRVVEGAARNATIVVTDGVGCGLFGIEGLPILLGWRALRRRPRRRTARAASADPA
ncbi:MAG: hypothetical protein HKP30_06410, partial [Myxococcales bacterium]|nr:hypothetical protein [Myxococcales bacterium]